MKLALLKETIPDETRVALVPQCVTRLTKSGIDVTVESGAGTASSVADADYEKAGASIAPDAAQAVAGTDLVIQVRRPGESDVAALPEGCILLANLGALGGLKDGSFVDSLSSRKITALSMDCVPRITRAQSMDVLSSQSNLAGYKAVIIAAEQLPKIMPMLMTAAGTISAAKVFVLGAGVAGLQAIATAKRLGAIVEAFDTRAAVKEQVESLGARFVEFDLGVGDSEDAGGYAKALTEDQQKKQQELLAEHMKQFDAVITTALVPGRRAPILITEETVKGMRHGSVVVDLAAEMGGNCECTEPGEIVVKHGVTICGRLNLPATLAVNASQMFSKNMSTLLLDLYDDGKLNLDPEDEVVAGALITRNGEVVHAQTKEALSKEQVG